MLTAKEIEPISLVLDERCQHFSLDAIRSATENFSEGLVIGSGGFGKVYKGHIHHRSASHVAIKRLDLMSNQGSPEFRTEIEMLSKLRHCNIVSLIGYCNEGKEMILVYDYMPHGTLKDWLSKADDSLTWLQRLRICIGAARGLEYLHTGTGTQHGIVHRDVKSSNILLDDNFAAKVSDFGLAKIGPTNQTCTYVSTGVKGTFGYMDPYYFYTEKLTRKSDVYSFGVVLLEVISGRSAVDSTLSEEQWGLAPWAQGRIKEGKLGRIIDSRLTGQISSNCLKQFAGLACRCLNDQPNHRPTMSEIIARLELILSLEERLESSMTTEDKFINKLKFFFPTKIQFKASKWMFSQAESSEAGHKLINTIDTSGTAHQLIHFEASSFTVEDLRHVYAKLIYKGRYWTSYRATMENGDQLVVRRMKKGLFWNEETALEKIHDLKEVCHSNILMPKAYYYSKDETLYIAEWMKKRSVSAILHFTEGQRPKRISWSTRMGIVIGITRGLVHLHTQQKIVHGYLTSGNVFIDQNNNPVIADVQLSLLTDDARPKFSSNHAPELLKFKDANMKTDVYSLGLIMLELLTRKRAISSKKGFNLPSWVMSIPREEMKSVVFDKELDREKSDIKQDMVRVLEIAMSCVSFTPNTRPKVEEVLQQLEEILVTDEKETNDQGVSQG
ncbi:serine-threonine/tyrosine-protein kinase catalytic domain-containing protein [Artemisia annua]|uniref:Serine-threonine/tyrosine-protein kinase catalytic domain-containing protein n=1 Tax=Artemisia annua TaxID=35608 RepID=A0A2U1QJ80_ARTAN|nr:serine-threonine/tyrosine-protein kinase catalytic domain-containing protein [Artemisia annua]